MWRGKWVIWLLAVICAYFYVLPSFAQLIQPLPVAQVFQFSATRVSTNKIIAEWQIAPGYYLYKQRIHVTLNPDTTAELQFPPSELKHDLIHRGNYEEVYSGHLVIPIMLPSEAASSIKLTIQYQGCAQAGLCYPPVKQQLTLNTVDNSLRALLSDQNSILTMLSTQHFTLMLFMFVGLGMLLAFTPCVLPMVPILAGIIMGHKKEVTPRKAWWLSVTYVLGSAVTYALAGVAAAMMGKSLQSWLQQPSFIIIGSAIFVLLAFSLFSHYELHMPQRWQNKLTHWTRHIYGGSFPGVFLMGVVSTLIVSPCVTAPLVGVLMYIANSGDMVLGASVLFAMGLGMGLPLLLLGISAGKWLPKSGAWMEAVKKFFGLLMLGVAIWLLSRIAPIWFIKIAFACLLLGGGFFFAWYLPKIVQLALLNRIVGILIAVSGILLLAQTIFMQYSALPLLTQPRSAFVTVHSLSEFNQQLAIALKERRPVVVDFYADWCESCIVMEKDVFQSPEVQCALKKFNLIRIDLSKNSVEDEQLLKKLKVVAPPTILFYDHGGKQEMKKRIVGAVSAQQFLTLLSQYTGAICDKKNLRR